MLSEWSGEHDVVQGAKVLRCVYVAHDTQQRCTNIGNAYWVTSANNRGKPAPSC